MNRWPINKAYPWEMAPFFRILLPFAAGILCYYKSWLPAVPGPYAVSAGIVSSLLLAVLILQKAKKVNTLITFALTTLSLFAAGLSIAFYNDITNSPTWFGKSISVSKTYVARISAIPDEKEQSWKLPVSIIYEVDTTSPHPVSGHAIVYLEKGDCPTKLHKGDTILLPGKWEPLTDAGNPFEFSYATYCAHNNILHRQWCTENEIKLYGAANPSALSFTEGAHDWCMAQLSKYLAGHNAMGLLQAMLLGDEVNLDEDLRQAYANTGIVHIIAISGGNITIFFVTIAFVLGWIKHRKYLWVKYAVALPIIWFYVIMAGAQPSAMRAAVMFSILAFGIMMQKNSNGINQLLATAFVLLCAEPAWLFSIGFQLSFVAVLSILIFYRHVYNLIPVSDWKKEAKGKNKIIFHILNMQWSVLSMSIAAELLIAPIVVFYFHMYPVMFAIANVAAFIFMSVTLLSGMALIVLSPIPALAAPLAAFVKLLVSTFGIIVAFLQDAGPRSFRYLVLSGYETILFYIVIAGIASWLLLRQKRALFTGLSAACLMLFSLCTSEWARLYQRRLTVYNIAHTNHIELMNGCYCSVLNTDSSLAEKVEYTTRPARTNWRAWQEQHKPDQEIFCVNGKSILILNDKILAEHRFPVNFLILNCQSQANVSYLISRFSPTTVIAGNNYSKNQLKKIVRECRQAGITVHTPVTDGAFVLSN